MQTGLTLFKNPNVSPASVIPTFPAPHRILCKLLIHWAHGYVQIAASPLALQSTGLSWHWSHGLLQWNKLPQASCSTRAGCTSTLRHPRALPTEWYVLHVCCMERLPQSNQCGNLLGGRMGPVSNSQLDTSCLKTALLFSTYLCPQLQPAKLSHFKTVE